MSDRSEYPFIAIAAMSRNRVIGDGPNIPWRIPEDFRWFKRVTMGNTLIMGRKTFESIGKALPGRRTLVLSKQSKDYPNATQIDHLEQVFDLKPFGELFICGGGQIYKLALPHCFRIYLTLVKREVDGDVFFPAFESEFEHVKKIEDTPEYEINEYHRKKGPANEARTY